ncbi:MAG: agmatine deiminase family protein [Candidatus Nanopelagicales bacterium]
MAEVLAGTPRSLGYRMPAEWEPHAGTLMSWPCRAELWEDRLEQGLSEYAGVARAIAAYEPVVMACRPGQAAEVLDRCGGAVTPWEVALDDSWARDNGPVFVTDAEGRAAVVSFRFNAWGERWHPYDSDDRLPVEVAERLGLPLFEAPMVLEGGSFFVDGEGTVLVTEQCLLSPNRNPTMTRDEIERGLCEWLGATTVLWLPYGDSADVGPAGTDGHVDGVAQYVAPGRVLLSLPADPASPEHDRSLANLEVLRTMCDAAGRLVDVVPLDPGPDATAWYANHYLANGVVVVPVDGAPADEHALAQIAAAYPDREVVGVPGATIQFGGGGPHCITQQIPLGVDLSAFTS